MAFQPAELFIISTQIVYLVSSVQTSSSTSSVALQSPSQLQCPSSFNINNRTAVLQLYHKLKEIESLAETESTAAASSHLPVAAVVPDKRSLDPQILLANVIPDAGSTFEAPPKPVCNQPVEEAIDRILECAVNLIPDNRLPAVTSTLFDGITVQLYNGWAMGVWNVQRNASKLSVAVCSQLDGHAEVDTEWIISNPSIFTYFRVMDTTETSDLPSCSDRPRLVWGYATIKNSFVRIKLTLVDDRLNTSNSVWVKQTTVAGVGQYLSTVEYFDPNDSQRIKSSASIFNWINQYELRHRFSDQITRSLLFGINHCMPTRLAAD